MSRQDKGKKSGLHRGFTLIEVMMVVAIMGIMMSIAVPNFQSFRCKAGQAETMANLATLRSALDSYVAEKGMPAVTTGLIEFRDCNGVNTNTPMGLTIQGKAGRYSYSYGIQAAVGATFRWEAFAFGCNDYAGEEWYINGTTQAAQQIGLNRCTN